jgi:hypothetical protein
MFLQGRASLSDNFRNLDEYQYLTQSDVFTGVIEKAIFSDYFRQDGSKGSNIGITVCNDMNKQKIGISIPVFKKNSNDFTGLISQLMFFAGIDIDNSNGLELQEIKDKNGNIVNSKKTNTPVCNVPQFKGVTITILAKRTGEGRDMNGNPVPYFEVFGWHIFDAQGFTASERKTGSCIIDKKYGRGLTFAEKYEEFMNDIRGNGGYQPQQQQQSQQQQPLQNFAPQYSGNPNAQPYRNLPPLPGRQPIQQQQNVEQQRQQFNQQNGTIRCRFNCSEITNT